MADLTVDSIRWAALRLHGCAPQMAGELNELDGAVGDGDLGVNLGRAFDRLAAAAPALPDDVGLALLECAMAFTKVTASTFGTLLATGLMAAAKLTRGRHAVPWEELPALLAAASEAIQKRGGCAVGDKTVVDAIEAARRACAGLSDPQVMALAAAAAIQDAMAALRPNVFRQGRARIFGERAAGKDDPGMAAFLRIVQCLASSPEAEPQNNS